MKEQTASRKEKIMTAALLLFAERGYENTTTKLIAQKAEVSEALIFKHFENKDKLLYHLIKAGYRRIVLQNKGMLSYQEPKLFLQHMVELPQKLVYEEPMFWKLQERLSHNDFSKQQHNLFMKPVTAIMEKAFKELGYEDPASESQFLLLIIDTLWKKAAINEIQNMASLVATIKLKYNLN
ncbi:TetR/AcrR family transcriptional regulator [Olivibacter sitiensis]|uniref:TetR/AcrR family transcriptional regulator n=1 Tax=Olivibacter sitiensis TaxID=376470 RepID=UPI0004157AC1|nr:TetR/AcrR family transcriptional regulator [Olivibacter sitiensis]